MASRRPGYPVATGTRAVAAQHERAARLGLAGQPQAGERGEQRGHATRPAPSGPAAHRGRSARPTPKARWGWGRGRRRNSSGVVEDGGVAVGRAEQHGDLLALLDRAPRPPRRARSRCARRAAARSRSAASPPRTAATSAAGPQPAPQHRGQPVAEHVDRRLVAGVEQQHRRGDHLVLGQLGGRQVADQVVARAGARGRRTSSRTRPAKSAAARDRRVDDRRRRVDLVHPHDRLRPVPQRRGVRRRARRAARRSPAPAAARRTRRSRRSRPGRPRRAARRPARRTRGRSRSTWPRPNAAATGRRSRVCSGGSFSIIWLRCSRLNGSR